MSALRRSRMVELDAPECLLRLREQQYGVGRVAVGGDVPSILPVNYLLDGSSIVVRTGSQTILDAGAKRRWLAFEIDALPDAADGTAEVYSVVVKGPASVVEDPDERVYLRLSRLEPAAGGFTPGYVRIAISELTGRGRR